VVFHSFARVVSTFWPLGFDYRSTIFSAQFSENFSSRDAGARISKGFLGQLDQLGIVRAVTSSFFTIQGFKSCANNLIGIFIKAGLHTLFDVLAQWAKIDSDEVGRSRHENLA